MTSRQTEEHTHGPENAFEIKVLRVRGQMISINITTGINTFLKAEHRTLRLYVYGCKN